MLLVLHGVTILFEGISIGAILPVLQVIETGGDIEPLREQSQLWRHLINVTDSLNVPLLNRITDISLDKSKLLYVQGGDHGEAVSIDIESMDMQMSEMNGEFGECPWCDFYYPKNARFTYDDNYIVFEDDQNLYVREGDFVLYNGFYFEVVKLSEQRLLFGQAGHEFEISARCRRARKGLFDAS